MWTVLVGTLILCGCGIVAGVTLVGAARVFAVKTDERVETIEALLPGANCGGCGNPSCYNYAVKLVSGEVEPNRCVLSKQESLQAIGDILGIKVEAALRRAASVCCLGGMVAAKQYEYAGMPSCRVAVLYTLGDRQCQWSCLGFGDCSKMCKFDAIYNKGRSIPFIDADKCTGCGACAAVCPKDLIKILPVGFPYVVCSTKERGKAVSKECPIGCIHCLKCVKGCPEGAIKEIGGIIKIEYSKCIQCYKCVEECPRKILKVLSTVRQEEGATA
ncbi:MAG: 4Fe-4S binding protein [Candidatus Magnetoovum sp. WYHC-5]|nr:4Fe-4S binding protein [Candidatus Magnetoovum sp. WYHC-5]